MATQGEDEMSEVAQTNTLDALDKSMRSKCFESTLIVFVLFTQLL
jgi:hypothetical protein